MDHLQKTKNKYKKILDVGDTEHIYQNKLDKACF